MDKDFIKFWSNEVNAYKIGDNSFIGREKCSNGEYIVITIDGVEAYKFWNVPEKSKNPKHTGGKKSYTKLYTEWLQEHPEASIEVIGLMTRLSTYIDWKSKMLVRDKRKNPLRICDIYKITNKSDKTITKIINEAKELNLLTQTSEGYFISQSFLQKGVSK